jgi:MFS family permease
LRFTVLSTIISAFVMFGYWGLFFWIPGFLAAPVGQGGAGLDLKGASLGTALMMMGAFCGYVSFGFFADRFGRRPTFAVYLLISALLVRVFGTTRDTSVLLMLGPLVGFFGSGYFSAFGAFLSELFPTRVRGAAVGFCYNVGRMLSALAPTFIGALSIRYGFGGALVFLAVAFAAGGLCIFLLPETQGRELT